MVAFIISLRHTNGIQTKHDQEEGSDNGGRFE